MAEKFMTFAHFILQAQPSPKLRSFLKRYHDIVGQLNFCWIDIPESSIVSVTKQILTFDV